MKEIFNIKDDKIEVSLEKNEKICLNMQINNSVIKQIVYNKNYVGINEFATINVNRVRFYCKLTTPFIIRPKYRFITYSLN